MSARLISVGTDGKELLNYVNCSALIVLANLSGTLTGDDSSEQLGLTK